MSAKDPLYTVNPNMEVEMQVEAFFAPLYQLIPRQHHEAIAHVERHMISMVKSALRLPTTEPVPPDLRRWPWGCGERLEIFLSTEQRRELRQALNRENTKVRR